MNTSSDSTDPLASADTVALVIHGVGDHTRLDLLSELEHGFAAAAIAGLKGERVEIAGIPRPKRTLEQSLAFRIDSNGHQHFVLPIVWSRFRPRAADRVAMHMLNTPMDGLVRALPDLLGIVSDAFRCIPKASGLVWKFGVTAMALLLIAVVYVMAATVFYVVQILGFWTLFESPLYATLGVVAVGASVVWVMKMLIRALDIVGDVAHYIGRYDSRREIEGFVRSLIRSVSERAPRARIIIAAHSLGSVVVAHSLLRDPADEASSRFPKVTLLTLGSPLKLMSYIFPRYVVPPEELLKRFIESDAIEHWLNAWRDRDYIGRVLINGSCPKYAECAIGNGPHRNYWGDMRVWHSVISLVTNPPVDRTKHMCREWSQLELTEAEQREIRQLRQFVWGQVGFVSLGALMLSIYGLLHHSGVQSRWVTVADQTFLRAIYFVWAAVSPFGIANALWIYAYRNAPAREQLGRLRRARQTSLAIVVMLFMSLFVGLLAQFV